jgi:chloramphenicol-sensitive protein RarD
MSSPANHRPGGLPHALGAFLIWGLLPLYLRLVQAVPSLEFFGWRIVFTLPVCLVLVISGGQFPVLRQALSNPRTVMILALSAALIGTNWLVYVIAIHNGHVYAASIGYYANPLVNVLLGTLFLGERLSRRQWLAVALAGIAVAVLAWGARDTLAISVVLALSFGTYGLVRKLAPVEALAGLTIETLLLVVPAALFLVWLGRHGGLAGFAHGAPFAALLSLSGVVTAVPLLLFAIAARRMDYSSLGFIQFLAPTLVFLIGLLVFHEVLRPVQLACLMLMWLAIGVFCYDLWARRGASRAAGPGLAGA